MALKSHILDMQAGLPISDLPKDVQEAATAYQKAWNAMDANRRQELRVAACLAGTKFEKPEHVEYLKAVATDGVANAESLSDMKAARIDAELAVAVDASVKGGKL